MSVFIFDAPLHSTFDGLRRTALALLMTTYPWGFIWAVIRFFRRRKTQNFYTESTAVLLTAPLIQILMTALTLAFIFSMHKN